MEKYDLGYRSLKHLVYDFIRDQMGKGELKQNDPINMEQTARALGISKTPLREALIKLETEGFVKIIPWKGVIVAGLTVQDFRENYQIIGALERSAIISAAPRMKKQDIMRMEILNDEMKEMLDAEDFNVYYEKNVEFHQTYLRLANNQPLLDLIEILKKRLYEFARPKEFIREWEDLSLVEHGNLIAFLQKGEFQKAGEYLESTIWSFDVQRPFIVKYYRFDNENGAKA